MKRKPVPNPTAGELEILNVLWQRGPSTVKDVHDALQTTKPALYTTVLKLLQIMTDKGLVLRDEKNRAHVYRPAARPDRTQKRLVENLIDKAFGGSAAQLVLHALEARPASDQELDQIREMLDKYKGGTR